MKKAILGALFAGAMLASCSSDEPVVNGGEDNGKGELGYVAVNICQPKSIGSRAASSGFEYGSDDENEAKTAKFYIYKQNGDLNSCKDIALSGKGTGNNPEVERIYSAVLVIDGAETLPSTSDYYQIVCVLNPPSSLNGTEDLSTLREKIENFGISEAGKFIMTNSVYKNGNDDVCGAVITANDIKTSAAEATASPVKIYVERVVAKIRSTKNTPFTNNGTGNVTINGESTSGCYINITGFEIANIAEKSYLIKNITDIDQAWTWNDPNNKRSYWETTSTISNMSYGNKSYSDIATTSFDWSKFSNDSTYVQPNTGAQNTAVLVTAQLTTGQGDNKKTADLVWMKGGYFDNTSAKNMVCQLLANENYAVKTVNGSNTEYRSIVTTDLEWKNKKSDNSAIIDLKDYQACAQVKSDLTVVKYNFSTNAEVTGTYDAVNDYLCAQKSYFAEVFTDGKCYYFVKIDQKNVATDLTSSLYGVVRNHIYALNLNSITGIGTAVFDPTKVIIPETPNHNNFYYLGAEVNVLAWKLVNQDVNFGQ